MKSIKTVRLVQPASAGGNFEYIAIPRQGLLFLSGALGQWSGDYAYEREIWFEDRCGLMDPDRDLEGVDILMVSALINEAPRAYEIARLAKQHHPDLITIGGGPQMGPLPDEAFRLGNFDVVVQREGEGIIGLLCDVLLNHRGNGALHGYLEKIPGISYRQDGAVQETKRVGLIPADFVELPDFRSVKGLTKETPWTAGVLETVRGCTERCTFCQVIQQFLGYRLVQRETELKRLRQLRELADEGLIYRGRNGKFSVFISDDLHPPPLRAVKFRNERFERLKGWAETGATEDMSLTCQARVEIAQDPELYEAMLEANIRMLYLGVESDNPENLAAVNKRQEAGQLHRDLSLLDGRGFSVVAMTIIGLPYDTEESIMALAEWVTQVSRFQTANLLMPLPATSNWDELKPLNVDGEPLGEGETRPYHLYTGRQFVHEDPRWSMDESRELFDRFFAKLNSIDTVYAQVSRFLRKHNQPFVPRLAVRGEAGDVIGNRIGEAMVVLREWADDSSGAAKRFGPAFSRTAGLLARTLQAASQPLANESKDVVERVGDRLAELTAAADRGKLTAALSDRMTELTETLERVGTQSRPSA